MKFDIARKVVEFQNGQYGIRRWTLIGYEFLDLSGAEYGYWWICEENVARYAAGTEKQARAALKAYLNPPQKSMPLTPGYDKGRPA